MTITRCTLEELRAALNCAGLSGDPLIEKAIALAIRSHGHQERLGGGSVLEEHIFPVTLMMLEESAGEPLAWRRVAIAGILLHDTVEDSGVTLGLILTEFGAEVHILVALMTDTGKTVEVYFALIAADRMAARGKLCDRRNNLKGAHKIPDPKMIRDFCDETERFVLPLAEQHMPEVVEEIRAAVEELRRIAG